MDKVYISGRISGIPYYVAVREFTDAEYNILDAGYTPVNPLKNGLHQTAQWEEHMLVDIKHLFECPAILMLSSWTESHG